MYKKIYSSVSIALAALLFSGVALAESNALSWKVTVDQKRVPKNYHITISFINSKNNSMLGSSEVTYPAVTSQGVAYVYKDQNDKYPIGYLQASYAQEGAKLGQKTELYSINCYDLNNGYFPTVYLNYPQDFSATKPNCGK